ncbi:hypothetical protein FB567DRAFT_554470 [Paraphoma chrysanthemicola]|uniref:Apple domain-containing protein n=1 Tax=Paraphoma chrysanthemicola TaxID=798071 RepID=A0A8K0VSJ0_9PLEO|nr:hypothetical protein FB567DRAFT_554470 [Paraphoma chrysanthemicola]
MVLSVRQSLVALSFASAALATQPWFDGTILGRDLEIRQTDTSKCDPNGYRSPNGLNFTTYCGQNNPFNDAQQPYTSPSFTECMDRCSRYKGNGEGCFGVVWVESSGACWLRNSTTGTANLVKKDGHYSALVIDGQMDGFPTACPADDNSVHDLSGVDGLGYTVNCGKVISGYDQCFSSYPKPCLTDPYQGFYHTSTLEECLRICVDQHPLCKAVSWNPGLQIGFANCLPKTGWPDGGLTTPGSKQGTIHSATITRIDPIDRTCPSSKTYTSSSGGNKRFDLHCGQVNTGTNITSLHTQNVTACMDACATSNQNCIGVLFDSQLAGGFKNCYLQNTTNTISDLPSATYAALSGTGTPSSGNSGGNNNNSSGGGSSSKAWIAGPVIGGIAFIALLAFAYFWYWRRRAARANPAVEKDGQALGAYGPAPAYSPGGPGPGGYYDGGVHASHGVAPTELGGGQGASEMPASTKYAHAHEGKAVTHELPS